MRKGTAFAAAAWVLVLAAGCQTTHPEILTIPVARDYRDLPPTNLDDAADAVRRARQAGAAAFAPYEYYSAEEYLEMARQQKSDRNRAAVRDYATLARDMAEAALRRGDGVTPPAAVPRDTPEAVQADFDRLRTRYDALDAEKAAEVAPVLFARITADLSRAEFALEGPRGWRDAAGILEGVESDLNALAAQDTDGDGIPDMEDADPLAPEDMDGFEDDDGAPDLDNDRDGIPDVVDADPNRPETPNGYHDADGAPDDYPVLDSIHFADGSTALSADAKGYLRGVKLFLDEHPDLNLYIRGYADNRHSEVYSMDLSQRRAQAVQQELAGQGAPAHKLIVTYHGATAGDGKTRADRVDLAFE